MKPRRKFNPGRLTAASPNAGFSEVHSSTSSAHCHGDQRYSRPPSTASERLWKPLLSSTWTWSSPSCGPYQWFSPIFPSGFWEVFLEDGACPRTSCTETTFS